MAIRKFILTSFALLAIFFAPKAKASHLMGVDLTYECINNCTIRVHIRIYRDCSGITPTTPAINVQGPSLSCIPPLLVGPMVGPVVQEVTPLCPGLQSQCSDPLSSVLGVEEWYWYQDYDICQTNCQTYTFSWSSCCRNPTITSLSAPGSTGMGIYSTTFNGAIQPCNSSPQFNNPPVPFICANTPFTFNQGATDAEGDSLVYSLGPCYTDLGSASTVTYNPGFTAQQPLGPDWIVSINPITGDISIVPNPASATPGSIQSGVLCVYVQEWRGGVLINTIVRDVQINVIACPQNTPPAGDSLTNVSGGFATGNPQTGITVAACVGSNLCFDIPSTDPNAADNVTMWWDQALAGLGATFVQSGNPGVVDTVNGTGSNPPVATFCWTPTSPGTYNFLVELEDDACPIIGFSQFTVTINVIETEVTGAFNPATCGTIDYCAVPNTGIPPFTFSWSGSGGMSSTDSCFSFNYSAPGTYTWYLSMTDSLGCVAQDSGTVTIVNTVTADAGPDLFYCQGLSGNIGTPGVPGVTYSWSPTTGLTNPNAAQTGVTLTNPGPGPLSQTYVLTATDAQGCEATDTVVVTVTVPPTLNFAVTNVSCFGGSDGAIDLTVVDGTPPSDYIWSGPGGFSSTNEDISNLFPGTYFVTVTDSAGCVATGNAIVTEPQAPLTTSITGTNISCNGGTNGSIDLATQGGTSPYDYDWSNSATTQDLSNVGAGWYYVTVTDSLGCVAVDSLELTEPPAINLTTESDDIGCNGDLSGVAIVTAGGGQGGFSYSWSPGGSVNDTVTGLGPGTYTVTVTDAGNCTATAPVTINEPQPLDLSFNITNASCNGSTDGSITATASGGYGNYHYQWAGGPALGTYPNISSGMYYITLTDTFYTTFSPTGYILCTYSDSAEVTAPSSLVLGTGSTDVICFGQGNGTAWVTVQGGTFPYSYVWSNGQLNDTITGLITGNYVVTVTDGNGCTEVAAVFVDQPPVLNVQLTADTAFCGDPVGSASASGNGGVGGYTYAWSNGQNGPTATNLGPGQVTVTLTDANGCTTTGNIIVPGTLPPTVSITNISPVTCNGYSDGSVTVAGSGGTGSLIYQWSNGQNGPTATGLNATSIYVVTVTDSKGCAVTQQVQVPEPTPVTANLFLYHVGCNSTMDDGEMAVQPSGGNGGPYTYLWSNGSTNQSITLLSPGVYSVTITDSKGCTAVLQDTIIRIPSPVLDAGVDVSFCEGEGGVLLDVTTWDGTQPYYYQWWCDSSLTYCGIDSVNDDDPLVNPTNSTWYYVQVTDANGCFSNIDSLYVTVLPKPIVDAGDDIIICGDSAPCVTLNPTVSNSNGPFSYEWLPHAGLSDPYIPNPCARPDTTTIYTLIVTDLTTGCTSQATTVDTMATVTVFVNPVPIADAGPDRTICLWDTIMLTGNGYGAGPLYDFEWSPGNSLSDSTLPNPMAFPTLTTEYILTVWSNGCPSYGDTVRVNVLPTPTLFAGFPVEICLGDTALLDAQANLTGLSWNWWPSDGVGGSTQVEDLYASPDSTTTYYVEATTAAGCRAIDSTTIYVKPTPIAEAGPNVALCGGDTLQLQGGYYYTTTDSVPNQNTSQIYYSWTPGATISDTTKADPMAWPGTSTWYYLTVNYNTCSTEDSVLVSVHPEVFASADIDTSAACAGDSVQLYAAGGIGNANFTWFPSTGLSNPNAANPMAAPDTSMTYYVVVDEGGCSDTASVSLDVHPTPTAAYFSSLTKGCAPFTVDFLQASADAEYYIWDFGDGSPVMNGSNPTHVYETPGTYTVTLTAVGTGGCSDRVSSIQIDVAEGPLAEFHSDPTHPAELALPNAQVHFFNDSRDATTFFWNFGDGSASEEQHPVHDYTQPGTYMVLLTVENAFGCVDTVAHGPYVIIAPDLFIPNVFTPNDDEQNDVFLVNYTGSQPFYLKIYDRWGNILHQSANKNAGWDGNLSDGKAAPEGVYFYQVNVGDKQYVGEVTLLR